MKPIAETGRRKRCHNIVSRVAIITSNLLRLRHEKNKRKKTSLSVFDPRDGMGSPWVCGRYNNNVRAQFDPSQTTQERRFYNSINNMQRRSN